MSFASIVDTAAHRHRTIHYYGSSATDLTTQFAGRNVSVDFHRLPSDGPAPFVVIKDGDDFLGAVSETDLQSLLSPSISPPWRMDEAAEYRALYSLLDDTVFASLDRRQLLAASREIEDRAYRVGQGHLSVGFQSHAAFDAQRAVYRRLASDTALDIHIYVVDETQTDDMPGITIHVEPTPEIGHYWFMAFDGGDDRSQQCALVARQDGDTYEGVWTYDPTLVERVFAAVEN